MLASNDVFYGSAMLFLFLIPLVWLAKPARGTGASDAAAGAH
jgi:DHA2 family multidrug resistance protein